jgi:hypothetical protein
MTGQSFIFRFSTAFDLVEESHLQYFSLINASRLYSLLSGLKTAVSQQTVILDVLRGLSRENSVFFARSW